MGLLPPRLWKTWPEFSPHGWGWGEDEVLEHEFYESFPHTGGDWPITE